MATTTLKSGGISLDTTDFRQFAKALRRAEPQLNKRLRKQLRAAGDLVAAEARSRVSPYSKSIPPTIAVRATGTTVSVIAGKGVPLAGLFELGSKRSAFGVFRAPNYPPAGTSGSDAYVRGGHTQPMHPFLGPALAAKANEAETLIINALDETIAEIVAGD